MEPNPLRRIVGGKPHLMPGARPCPLPCFLCRSSWQRWPRSTRALVLLLYPSPAWQPIRDQILKASSLDPRAASIKRVLVGNARTEELDYAGRILVANELREYANLGKTVYLVGMGTHFEIWSEAGWKQQNDLAAEALSGELPPGLGDLVL